MQRAGEFYVSRDDLLQAGLPAEHLSQGEINVSRLPQVTAQYDSSGQRLLLSVPQDWLSERATAAGRCLITTSAVATRKTATARPLSGTSCAFLTMWVRSRQRATCGTFWPGMASGNNRLSYEIYKASTTNRGGSVGTERWASSASSSTSSDGLLRTYNYTAVVLPSQSTPPAGTYTDTVVVDIAF